MWQTSRSMFAHTSTFGPELSPGRAAILHDLRERAAQRRQRRKATALTAAALGVASIGASGLSSLIGLDLGAWSSHLQAGGLGLLVLSGLAAHKAAHSER